MNVTTTPLPLPRDIDEIDGPFLTAALTAWHPGTVVRVATAVDVRQGSASSLSLPSTSRPSPPSDFEEFQR